MEKEQYRSVIRFLFLEGKTRSEIKDRLDAVYGDSSPSMATVKNWFNEFVRGRTSVFDEPRQGAPKTAATNENIKKIHDLVLADRRLKVSEIAETVGIAEGTVHHILHEELGMRNMSAQWVQFDVQKAISPPSTQKAIKKPKDEVKNVKKLKESTKVYVKLKQIPKTAKGKSTRKKDTGS